LAARVQFLLGLFHDVGVGLTGQPCGSLPQPVLQGTDIGPQFK